MNKRNVNLYWDKWNFGPEERAGIHPSTPSKYIKQIKESNHAKKALKESSKTQKLSQ